MKKQRTYIFRTSIKSRTRACDSSRVALGVIVPLDDPSVVSSRFRFAESVVEESRESERGGALSVPFADAIIEVRGSSMFRSIRASSVCRASLARVKGENFAAQD